MSTDLRAIMHRDERRRRMLNDPDLTGSVLLFALALDEVLAVRREQRRRRLGNWLHDVSELAWGDRPDARDLFRVKSVISDDIPRYEPVRSLDRPCIAPMIRREGLCGRHGTRIITDRDPETGEAREIGLCSRHRDLEASFDARRRAWVENGKPSPPPNMGGVLRRYFDTDWPVLYKWAAPWRTPLEGEREATPPRPTLRLVRDDEQPTT